MNKLITSLVYLYINNKSDKSEQKLTCVDVHQSIDIHKHQMRNTLRKEGTGGNNDLNILNAFS